MKLFQAEQVKDSFIREFLEKYEYSCAQLCSSVRRGEEGIFVLTRKDSVSSAADVFGVISVTGAIHHCLPFLKNENQELDKILQELFYGKKILCIDGEKKGTEYLKGLLESSGLKVRHTNEYFLMVKEDDALLPPPASLLCMGEEIVCCKTDHEEDLYDLQKHYLIEEVSPGGEKPSDLYVKSNVKSILKNQKVFAIENDGKFVAKANTNAIGWNWVQIGGVYTDPLYRRNGYALCLVSTLARRIYKTGRKMCLFVNKKNIPALSLYEKLEFRKSCDFQIIYF